MAALSREAFAVIDVKGLLRDLLDAYKSPLEREAVNQENRDEVLTGGVMITLDLPDDREVSVSGSESRLTQVFQNILSNALSFAPEKNNVRIVMSIRDGKAVIVIEDEGTGIPQTHLEKIFERFYSERPAHEEYGTPFRPRPVDLQAD